MTTDATAPESVAASLPDENYAPRWAFLLEQIAISPDGKLSEGKANAKLTLACQKTLGMSKTEANQVRQELVDRKFLQADKTGRTKYYSLTEAGRQHLEAIREHLPRLKERVGKENPPANDRVHQGRIAYLLLQLFQADQTTLSQGDANKSNALFKTLELNAATAKKVRHELRAAGYIDIAHQGRNERYTLTPSGRDRLAASGEAFKALGDQKLTLTVKALGELLEAARDAANAFKQIAPSAAVPAEPPAPEVVAQNVLEALEELRRERHSASGVVPIHEIRREIRKRLGEQAASHLILDEVILGMGRDRLRLSAITDRSRATKEELNASIPGMGETLFYLETAHEFASR